MSTCGIGKDCLSFLSHFLIGLFLNGERMREMSSVAFTAVAVLIVKVKMKDATKSSRHPATAKIFIFLYLLLSSWVH
jgi:amino acid permease